MLPILMTITIAATNTPQQLPDVSFQNQVSLATNQLTAVIELSESSYFIDNCIILSYQLPFVYISANNGNLNQLWIQGAAGDSISVAGS